VFALRFLELLPEVRCESRFQKLAAIGRKVLYMGREQQRRAVNIWTPVHRAIMLNASERERETQLVVSSIRMVKIEGHLHRTLVE
jgi:hypothetical protein